MRLAANGPFLAVVLAYVMRELANPMTLKVLPVELPGDSKAERDHQA